MKRWSVLLFPFAWIYGVVTTLRNCFFDWGWISSYPIEQSSIGVGNLSVGGTGKSVVIDFLISHLKRDHIPVVISRGYKRSTRGVVIATEKSTAQTLGDEPYQMFSKQGVAVVVAEKRVAALKVLNQIKPHPEVLLFDDVLQHRYVQPKLMLLTTTYSNPYYSDHLIPRGRLRESKSGAKRASILLVTKCPKNLSKTARQEISKRINPLPNQSVFFTSIAYHKKLLNRQKEKALASLSSSFFLITGIANPEPLVKFLKEEGKIFEHLNYPNHHEFKPEEIEEIKKRKQTQTIVTTEKDFGRLESYFSSEELFYLPITMEFLEEKEAKEFKTLVASSITKN
jgi:tetraacyldisaccharide 4'-kinase